VVQRTVREVSGIQYPVLTHTNYGEWAVLMKVMLKARKLWHTIETGTENEEDCVAMEAILRAIPPEHVESLGSKDTRSKLGTPSRSCAWAQTA
jgi:hypothetical protein